MGKAQRERWQANVTDIAWAAGILDGEGCIRIKRNNLKKKTIHYGLEVSVKMVDKATIERLKELFPDCSIYTERSSRGYLFYRWCVFGETASEILEEMLPYLVTKKDQAELAIEFIEMGKEPGRHLNGRLPEGVNDIREDMFLRLKDLKRKHLLEVK